MIAEKPADSKHIISVTGLSASGKSTLAEHLRKNLDMGMFSLGNYQRAEFAAYGSPLEYHAKLSLETTYYGRWPAYIAEISKNMSGLGVVVEAVYSLEFLKLMQKSFLGNPIHLIGIQAPQERRTKLFMAKSGLSKAEAESQLARMDEIKIEVGVEKVFKFTDLRVQNDGTLEEFKELGKTAAIYLLRRR